MMVVGVVRAGGVGKEAREELVPVHLEVQAMVAVVGRAEEKIDKAING